MSPDEISTCKASDIGMIQANNKKMRQKKNNFLNFLSLFDDELLTKINN